MMNTDVLKGKWLQLKGSLKEQWGKLTDDDVDRVSGSFDRLVGVIQEKYGYQKDEAQKQVDDFLARYGQPSR
jgi:uncharacterized protein YjbJ (UPF0337 family)